MSALARSIPLASLTVCASLTLGVIGSAFAGDPVTATPADLYLTDTAVLPEVRRRLADGDPTLRDALDLVLREADKALDTPPQTVIHKPKAPSSGDVHDYVSLSPYWWPNPDTDDGLPYIRRDGEVNPERYDYDLPKLDHTARAVHYLGLAYYFTGDEKYARHAATLLRHFFLDPETRMNPNLRYAQFVPGRNEGKPSGIIETVRFRWMVPSIALLELSEAWTSADHEAMKDWFRQYVQWLRTSPNGQREAEAENNHGSWYAQQVAHYALFVGDKQTAREVIETVPERIAAQIEPDGSQPHEMTRTRTLHYHDFNLRALLDLAHLGEHVGVDLWSFQTEDGRSIRTAVEFVLPYYAGQKEWTHQEIVEPRPHMFAQALRRAAAGFKEPRYEAAIERIPDGLGPVRWLNLLEPGWLAHEDASTE